MAMVAAISSFAASKYDNPDTIVVARDGTGEFRNVADAIEVCRAFMEYHKVIFVKSGVYKEKIILPQWLTNIEILGEDVNTTIITWDDHANIRMEGTERGMGTFRTYTLRVEEYHHRKQCQEVRPSRGSAYRGRPPAVYQLPTVGQSRHRVHRYRQ